MSNQELYEQALKAIFRLFSDTSVSPSETVQNLNELIGEIKIMIDALDAA